MFKHWKIKRSEAELNSAKQELTIAINENIAISEESINEISNILLDFRRHKYYKHDAFLNLCIFSSIVELDLTLLLEKIPLSKRVQEKKLYARVIAMTIVDYLENINVLIGKDCLQELKNSNMEQFTEEFKAVHKSFSTFRKNNEQLLREIRNTTVAHKSKDALKLKQQIDKVDVDAIFNLGIELKAYGDVFVKLSTKIIYYIVDYMAKAIGRSN